VNGVVAAVAEHNVRFIQALVDDFPYARSQGRNVWTIVKNLSQGAP
jgi:hypothetical protein